MSIKDFRRGFHYDRHEYRDFVYDWGLDSRSDYNESALADATYGLICEYLRSSLLFYKHGSIEPDTHEISYDMKWGWQVSEGIYRTFLGKLIPAKGSKIIVGASTYLAGINKLWGTGTLVIGSYCAIGPGNMFYTSEDGHPQSNLLPINLRTNRRSELFGLNTLEPDYRLFEANGGPDECKIGHGVWIGRNCILKRGSVLHNGVYLGEGSWVAKTLDAYCLYCGTPARQVRKRISDKNIEVLERIKWWNFSPGAVSGSPVLRHMFECDLTEYELDDIPEQS